MTGVVFLVLKNFKNVSSLEPVSLSHLVVLTKVFLNVYIVNKALNDWVVFFEFQLFVNMIPGAHLLEPTLSSSPTRSYMRQCMSLSKRRRTRSMAGHFH